MGCLIEFIFEIVFEVIVEAIGEMYIKLMTLIVPEHQFSEKLRKRIKNAVTVFAVLLFLCSLIGFFLFWQTDPAIKTAGAYMLFVPLGMMGIQIATGIIYRIIKAKNRR